MRATVTHGDHTGDARFSGLTHPRIGFQLFTLLHEHGLERIELARRTPVGRGRARKRSLEPIAISGGGKGSARIARPDPGRARLRPGRSEASAPGAACWIAAAACTTALRREHRRSSGTDAVSRARSRCKVRGGSGSGRCPPPRAFHLAQGHHSIGLGREDARAADLGREEAAALERSVADQLGIQPQTRLPPEQPVVGVDRLAVASGAATTGGKPTNSRSARCMHF